MLEKLPDILKLLFTRDRVILVGKKTPSCLFTKTRVHRLFEGKTIVGSNAISVEDRTQEETHARLLGSDAIVYLVVAPAGADIDWCIERLDIPSPHVLVSYDSIWKSMTKKRNASLKRIYTRVETEMVKAALENNTNVVLARYCGSQHVRKRFVQLARRYDAVTVAVVFKDPKMRKIPHRIKEIADSKFTYPTLDEGFDKILEVVSDNDGGINER